MGDYFCTMITILNITVVTIKIMVFERAISKDEKYITINWLCCLTFGKNKSKKKKKRNPDSRVSQKSRGTPTMVS